MDAKSSRSLRPEVLGLHVPDLRGENPWPDTQVSLLTTNDGIKVYGFEHARMELAFIMSEIMTDNEYFRHGIDVTAGSVVVDVGANIGLFGVAALARAPAGDATYIGIEPIPLSVQALRLNLLGSDSHGKDSFFSLNSTDSNSSYSRVLSSGAPSATSSPGATTSLGSRADVSGGTLHAQGRPPADAAAAAAVASPAPAPAIIPPAPAEAAPAPPQAAGRGGAPPAAAAASAAPATVPSAPAEAAAASQQAAGPGGAAACGRISASYPHNISIIRAAVSDVARAAAQMSFYPYMPGNSTLRTKEKEMLQKEWLPAYFEDSQQLTVPVTTLHNIIQQHNLAHIHLLKVDVEGEELAVLKGLSGADWSNIDQVVMEIHDCIDQPSGESMFDLEGDRGGGIDGSGIRFQGELGALSVEAAKRAEAFGGLMPPLTEGRVMAAARLLRDKGFRVVLECSFGVPLNYNAYAVKS